MLIIILEHNEKENVINMSKKIGLSINKCYEEIETGVSNPNEETKFKDDRYGNMINMYQTLNDIYYQRKSRVDNVLESIITLRIQLGIDNTLSDLVGVNFLSLTRKELQTLCKKHGIKANQKNSEMVNDLHQRCKTQIEEKVENNPLLTEIKDYSDTSLENILIIEKNFKNILLSQILTCVNTLSGIWKNKLPRFRDDMNIVEKAAYKLSSMNEITDHVPHKIRDMIVNNLDLCKMSNMLSCTVKLGRKMG